MEVLGADRPVRGTELFKDKLWYYKRVKRFKEILDLSDSPGSKEQFEKIKEDIRELCKQHIEISCPATGQPDKVDAVLQKMRERHPAFFGGYISNLKQRMFLARSYVYRAHTYRRKALLRSEKMMVERKKSLEPKKGNTSQPKCHVVVEIIRKRGRPRLETWPPIAPPTARVAEDHFYSIGIQDNAPLAPSLSNNPPDREAKVDDTLDYFLSSCRPPMIHLSRRFNSIGCNTRLHLFAMANWESDRRYMNMKKLLEGTTEMEIMFLEKHLDSYFGIQRGIKTDDGDIQI